MSQNRLESYFKIKEKLIVNIFFQNFMSNSKYLLWWDWLLVNTSNDDLIVVNFYCIKLIHLYYFPLITKLNCLNLKMG